MTGLRVASYNVHTCVGTDGKKSAQRVAAVIEALNADVVGLQEVESVPGAHSESMQMEFIAEETGYRPLPGPTILHTERYYGNVVLTRLPVRAVRRVDLSVEPYEPRGAVDVDLDVGGASLRFVNTHFGLRRRERWVQVRRLLDTLGSIDNRPTVLLGDFNDWWPWSGVGRALAKCFSERRWPRTFPSRLPLLSLDRILAGGGAHVAGLQVLRRGEARVASDHLPLVADLVL